MAIDVTTSTGVRKSNSETPYKSNYDYIDRMVTNPLHLLSVSGLSDVEPLAAKIYYFKKDRETYAPAADIGAGEYGLLNTTTNHFVRNISDTATFICGNDPEQEEP